MLQAPDNLSSNRYSLYLRAGIIAFICIGGMLVLFFFNPAHSSLFPPCPVKWLTGLNCPGCGSLRALHQLFHGNILNAFKLNPLLIIMLPFIGILLLKPSLAYRQWVPWTIFVLFIFFCIIRNMPFWPLPC